MTLKELFHQRPAMLGFVPLAISQPGYVYLNDSGMWNIMLNSTHVGCKDKTVTIQTILDIFEHNSSCYAGQQATFDAELPLFIDALKHVDAQCIVTL